LISVKEAAEVDDDGDRDDAKKIGVSKKQIKDSLQPVQ
jgi:hypothetical protein